MTNDLNKNQDLDKEFEMDEAPTETKFLCPQCGEITRDDVLFLCNTCDSSELIHQDGMYICPSCMEPGENFECNLCGSKEVVMKKPAESK